MCICYENSDGGYIVHLRKVFLTKQHAMMWRLPSRGVLYVGTASLLAFSLLPHASSFSTHTATKGRAHVSQSKSSSLASEVTQATELVPERFPTSVDDQVRQAKSAIVQAKKDGIQRHTIRLLLPLIGATELDDWPGGARQMMGKIL